MTAAQGGYAICAAGASALALDLWWRVINSCTLAMAGDLLWKKSINPLHEICVAACRK